MADIRIGTVDLPDRMERERYFRELDYLELSALFSGPLKPGVLAKWAEQSPKKSIGLLAPWVLTHRQPPKASKLWPHDLSVGDFRDSIPGRQALVQLREAVKLVDAACVIFQSPSLFAPSAANRDQLSRFFGEVATAENVGAPRVWVPDGLWSPRTATTFAAQLGITAAFDPLVRDPSEPPEIYYDLEVTSLYLRIAGLGRTGPIRNERQVDLIELLQQYEGLPTTIAFESPSRWNDARNLKKLLEGDDSLDD